MLHTQFANKIYYNVDHGPKVLLPLGPFLSEAWAAVCYKHSVIWDITLSCSELRVGWSCRGWAGGSVARNAVDQGVSAQIFSTLAGGTGSFA